MSKITKDIKTHVIITFNKTKHFITERQNEFLKTLDNNKKIVIDGSSINTGSISEILPIDVYHENNKDERKTYNNYNFNNFSNEIKIPFIPYGEKKRARVINTMIDSLDSWIRNNKTTGKAEKVLEKFKEYKRVNCSTS